MRKRGAVLASLGILAGVALATLLLDGERTASGTPAPAPVERGEPVATMTLGITDEIQITRRFPGRIEAPGRIDVAFEVGGRLAEVAVREGDPVLQGDVIARLDAEAIEVERRGLQASVAGLRDQNALARRDVERLQRLVTRGSAPAKSLEQARASESSTRSALREAEAALAGSDLRLRQTLLLAPADGHVGAVTARPDETLAAGQAFVSIFLEGANRLRVALPANLDPALLRDPRLSIGGQEVPVTMMTVRPDIDPATNSRSAVFLLPDQPAGASGNSPYPGQTGQLVAEVTLAMRGAWVPLDALRPNPEGTWMLIRVSPDGIAERVDVDIGHLRADKAFVSGAFVDGERVVAAGIHKVVPGQALNDRMAPGQ